LRDTEEEGKELKDKLAELEDVLRQSEAHRQELDQELLKKDQQVAALLDAQTKVCFHIDSGRCSCGRCKFLNLCDHLNIKNEREKLRDQSFAMYYRLGCSAW
jgi:septal ring factor EnvC (AmiA/AmiB activator)